MIEFCCSSCDKKLSVDPKYAGKKAKCPKCQERVRIPQADVVKEDDDLALDFDALEAELGGGTKACPKCEQACKQNAALCVGCGHAFDANAAKTIHRAKKGAFQSKKIEQRQARTIAIGGEVQAMIAGAVMALAAGGIWFGIAKVTGYELGWLAWGVGGLVGLAVTVTGGAGSTIAAGVAAVEAICGIVFGKMLITSFMIMPMLGDIAIGFDEHSYGFEAAMLDLYENDELPQELRPTVEGVMHSIEVSEEGDYDAPMFTEEWEQVDELAYVHYVEMDEEELAVAANHFAQKYPRYVRLQEQAYAEIEDSIEEVSENVAFWVTFGISGFVFCFLAMSTAFGMVINSG